MRKILRTQKNLILTDLQLWLRAWSGGGFHVRGVLFYDRQNVVIARAPQTHLLKHACI